MRFLEFASIENNGEGLTIKLHKELFDLEEDTQLIALLELRNEDYHLLSNGTLPQLLQQSLQTLYLSEPIVTTNGIIRMFYLPPLSSKIDERYQDMLANLSRYYAITCVGDLRSRQLRKGRSSRVVSPWQRNYAIVHTSGGELYQVVFQEGNKTEIQRKIRVLKKEEQVHEEILEMKGEVKVEDCRKLPGNVSLSGLIESICKELEHGFGLINGENTKIVLDRIFNSYDAKQGLRESEEYDRICNGKMLSKKEVDELINKTSIYNFETIMEIRTKNNKNYKHRLTELMEEVDKGVSSLSELEEWRPKLAKELEMYGIDKDLLSMVIENKQTELYCQEIIRLKEEHKLSSSEMEDKLEQLERELLMKEQEIVSQRLEISRYTAEISAFEHQRSCYISTETELSQTKQQLEKQCSANRQLEKEIEEKQREIFLKESIMEYHRSVMDGHKSEKNGLLEAVQQLTKERLEQIVVIDELSGENKLLKEKVEELGRVENRVVEIEENELEARSRLARYESYVKDMESMLKELQTSQIYKFNHVLESNYKRFETVKKELMGKENEMEAVRCELKEKNGLVDRQKERLNYFEKIMMSRLEGGIIVDKKEEEKDRVSIMEKSVLVE